MCPVALLTREWQEETLRYAVAGASIVTVPHFPLDVPKSTRSADTRRGGDCVAKCRRDGPKDKKGDRERLPTMTADIIRYTRRNYFRRRIEGHM